MRPSTTPWNARFFRRVRPTSLRTRIVAVFAVGSSILLVLTGAALYIGFNAQLEEAIDQALRDRAADIALDIREGNLSIRPGEPFAMLLDPAGQVLDTTAAHARETTFLSPRDLARARRGEVVEDRHRVAGHGRRARILARPFVTPEGRQVIIVVGESLDAVASARERLGVLLGVASPVLIGAVAWFGWVLAGAALRPVRRLSDEAEAISLQESGQRLRQPPGEDEIARLGHTLNAMLDRIEASVAHERAFIDDASHELRTPLSILRGELELAAEFPEGHAEVRDAIASALQEAERLGRLTEDLLVLARADRGRLQPRRDPVALLVAAREAAHRHRGGPVIEVAGEEVVVSTDPALLERILDNLVTNAVQHARRTVQLSVGRDGSGGILAVADDGPGFPSEFLPVALDRFTRADPNRGRHAGGSGLGLAIVDALVGSEGGRVTVGNGGNLGGGIVAIWLPAAAPENGR